MTGSRSDKTAGITVTRQGRDFEIPGRGGAVRERSFLPSLEKFSRDRLPVLLGSGSGVILETLLPMLREKMQDAFALAVVDKEQDILEQSGNRERFTVPGVTWITEPDPLKAISALTRWQEENGKRPFLPLENPLYLRLDRSYYARLRDACQASGKADFWAKTAYPKFKEDRPRILLLTSKYFLMGEIEAACKRMGIPHRLLHIPEGELAASSFVEDLLTAVVSFKPDFAFTINHLGVDREGVLVELLEKLSLPLASWFVDNPHLILYLYTSLVNPWTAIFTWDADNIGSLKEKGFEHVHYLPLGVDSQRFRPPGQGFQCRPDWASQVSFVGNSMLSKVANRMAKTPPAGELNRLYKEIASGFAQSEHRSVRAYLEDAWPRLVAPFDALPDMEAKLGYETMITWEATLQYRLSCVKACLPFNPLIAGDAGWHTLLPSSPSWRYHPEMNYYSDLPRFYPCSAINFNCTSKQMKGAVNQRVFDVPATESFLLTDYREQVENLFDPGREIVCYHSPEEAQELIARYLAAPKERADVAKAARKRILAQHTYEHRMTELISHMRGIFG